MVRSCPEPFALPISRRPLSVAGSTTIWAFKPTDKVDIRRFPEAERKAERADLAELSAYAYGKPLPPDETDDENEKPKQAPPETGNNTKSLGQ